MKRTISALAFVAIVIGIGRLWAGPGYGLTTIIGTAGTAGTTFVSYETTADVTIPACFRFGSRPLWQADAGKVVLAYSMARDIDFAGAVDTATERHLADPSISRTGPSVSLYLSAGERAHSAYTSVDYGQVYSAPGARAGLCTTKLETPSGGLARFPCDADADCSGIGAGTCQAEADFGVADKNSFRKTQGCTFVVAQTDTANAILRGNP